MEKGFSTLLISLFLSLFSVESVAPATYGNIMYDRRIVRGNTYAQTVLPAVSSHTFFTILAYENSLYFVICHLYYPSIIDVSGKSHKV